MKASTETITGDYIGEQSFQQIKPGTTTAEWVESVIGKPTRTSKTKNSELWIYDYQNVKRSKGYIFLLLADGSEKTIKSTAYIEIKDGIVINAWRE